MKNIKTKGSKGYIDFQKNDSFKKGLLGLITFVTIYLAGAIISGSSANYTIIVAVLVALPTAQALSRYFGYRKYKSIQNTVTKNFDVMQNVSVLYEMLIIRGRNNFFVDAVIVSNDIILLLVSSHKELKTDANVTRQEIQTLMNHKGIKVNTYSFDSAEALTKFAMEHNIKAYVMDEEKQELIVRAIMNSSM